MRAVLCHRPSVSCHNNLRKSERRSLSLSLSIVNKCAVNEQVSELVKNTSFVQHPLSSRNFHVSPLRHFSSSLIRLAAASRRLVRTKKYAKPTMAEWTGRSGRTQKANVDIISLILLSFLDRSQEHGTDAIRMWTTIATSSRPNTEHNQTCMQTLSSVIRRRQ